MSEKVFSGSCCHRPAPDLRAGAEWLRRLRIRLGITIRQVEALSRRIAEAEGNEDFYLSNGWLTQIENSARVPGIHKLFSLSAIYQVDFLKLVGLFGVNTTRATRYRFPEALLGTDLIQPGGSAGSDTVNLPAHFAGSTSADVADGGRMRRMWSNFPGKLAENISVTPNQYGFIGFQDFTMCPLLRPGSFVEIDTRGVRVESGPWRSELDRPIYFVELHEGYACAWCELKDARLFLVPHPLSPVHIRALDYPQEAEVIGRVVGVATRLVAEQETAAARKPTTTRPTREVA